MTNIYFHECNRKGYAARTACNIDETDVTFAFALDFSTRGEILTKNLVKQKSKLYVPITLENLNITEERILKLCDKLETINPEYKHYLDNKFKYIKIPQLLESGIEKYGTVQFIRDEYKTLINEHTSISMIDNGLRTRTTRSFEEFSKYNIKVGDNVIMFSENNEVLCKITNIYNKNDLRFELNWHLEGWTDEGFEKLKRYKNPICIEFTKVEFYKPLKLNISGNGIYSLTKIFNTQEKCDNFIFQFLYSLIKHLKSKIISINSGGQTGIDEAATKAAYLLNIPSYVIAPNGWCFRDVNNTDIYNQELFLNRFPTSQIITHQYMKSL
jgi:hypothetical protein